MVIREEEYKVRAEMIAKRLSWFEECKTEEKEVDSFIIWLFAQIEEKAVKNISCVARTGTRDNIWRVRYEQKEYFMRTGKDDEIYNVMKEAAEILDKIENVKAKYSPPEISKRLVTKNASIEVSII